MVCDSLAIDPDGGAGMQLAPTPQHPDGSSMHLASTPPDITEVPVSILPVSCSCRWTDGWSIGQTVGRSDS